MHPFKSPGPDGMSLVFFLKKLQHIVGLDVIHYVLKFLKTCEFDRVVKELLLSSC